MTSSLKKRFWSNVAVQAEEGGFGIRLDDRALKTPAKAQLTVPSQGLAAAIATEWDQLGDDIDPEMLPFTRLANAAIDNMGRRRTDTLEALAAYGETDLLCYRAESPEALTSRQADNWDPLLDWLRESHQIFLVQTTGILPVSQPPQSVSAFRAWLDKMNNFALMAVHDLIMTSGSIVISRAVIEGHISVERGWEVSIIDEMWQVEQWGEDEEAAYFRARKASEFMRAAKMMALLESDSLVV